MEKIKLSVNLTEEDVDTLRRVADQKGITMTEALRRAIALERFVENSAKQGDKLLIQGRDKAIRELVIR